MGWERSSVVEYFSSTQLLKLWVMTPCWTECTGYENFVNSKRLLNTQESKFSMESNAE